ncbi:MAG: hypothetical protein RIM84_21820 [Alphaproteobacteria bacterium]
MMAQLYGSGGFWVFLLMPVAVLGGAAYLTGQAVAGTWRPAWQVVGYAILLGFTDRFLVFALFEGELLSFVGFVIDTVVLVAIGLLAFRVTRVRKMVSQYPWLYESAGPFAWRRRGAEEA